MTNLEQLRVPDVQMTVPREIGGDYSRRPWTAQPPFEPAPPVKIGGGSPEAMSETFGHYTDPPSPDLLPGDDRFSKMVNDWLRSPQAVAEDEQRKLNASPSTPPDHTDETIVQLPEIAW
jgi:hypothetical protein